MRIDVHSHVIPSRIVERIANSPREFAARIDAFPVVPVLEAGRLRLL